jgi:hypothetical protein
MVPRGFDLLVLVLTIVALVIAFIHLFELNRTVRRMQRVEEKMATQYLGEFPSFLRRVNNVIKNAQKHLVIVCDFPAYADFSAPAGSDDYFYEIRKKRDIVELTILDFAGRQRYLNMQFPVEIWEHWRGMPDLRKKVSPYLTRHAQSPDAVISRSDLFRVMNERDDDILRDVFGGKCNQSTIDIPIYLWVADCDEAVFSISAPNEEGLEHGFYTTDRSLIKALLDLRLRYVTTVKEREALAKPCRGRAD